MIEVLKQMVEALETYGDKHRKTYLLEGAWDEEITKGDAAIKAGKQAIAELERQETNLVTLTQTNVGIGERGMEAYEEAKKRGWVGVSDE